MSILYIHDELHMLKSIILCLTTWCHRPIHILLNLLVGWLVRRQYKLINVVA